MTCNDIEQLIVQLVYDELEGEQKEATLKHIESCASCREIYNDLKESSVILSDSFSELDELKLTDDELINILKVDSEDEDAPNQPEAGTGKQPLYMNRTLGIAASLLLTCSVLMVIYWSKLTNSPALNVAMDSQKSESAPAEPASSPMLTDGRELTVEYEDEEVSEDELYVEGHVSGTKNDKFKGYTYGMSKDSSADAPSTADDSLSKSLSGDYLTIDKTGKQEVVNGTRGSIIVDEDTRKTDGSTVSSRVTLPHFTESPGGSKRPLPAELKKLQKELDVLDNSPKPKPEAPAKRNEELRGKESKSRQRDNQEVSEKKKAYKSTVDIGSDFNGPTDKDVSKINDIEVIHRRNLQLQANQLICEANQARSGEVKDYNVALDKYQTAEKQLKQISETHPDVQVQLKQLQKEMGRTYRDQAKDQLAEAAKGGPTVNFYKAEENLNKAIQHDPSLKKEGQVLLKVIEQKKEQAEIEAATDPETIDKEYQARMKELLVEKSQAKVFDKQRVWKRARDAYETILLRDPDNKEAVAGLQRIYEDLREAAQKRRQAQESERMSEIEWKWIDSIPPKDLEIAMGNEDPFANDLVAKAEKEKSATNELKDTSTEVTDEITKQDDIETAAKTEPPSEEIRDSYFKTIPVNPFVMTSKDALSTFALDTDTAAYTIARNYINQGYLPPAGSVRTEEFVNSFDYNYPGKIGDTFTVHAEAAPSPFGKGLVLLKVGVRGKVIGRDGRKPSNLVFAVDTSGSMERRDRMPLLKKGLNVLLDNLDPRDRISLVTYGRDSQLVLDNAPMSQPDTIRKAINDLQCGGSTNLNQGVDMAYRIAKQNFRSGAVNSIILCSDGMANIGAQTADSMVKAASTYRKHGISFNSVGFGMGNYNDDILETMANKGDGSYVFIDSAKTAVDFFTNELGNRLNVIAKDAKIQVKFDPRRVRRYRLLGYENRDIADKDFRNDTIDAGEVGSGQSATALYEVELLDNAHVRDLGTVFVRYKNPETNTVEEINSRLRGDIVQNRSVKDSPRFFLAAAVSEFAEILRNSEYAKGSSMTDVKRLAEQVAVQLPLDRKVSEFVQIVNKSNGLPRGK